MADKSVEFAPFHTLNEFMRPDYRQTVIRAALNALPRLPRHFRDPIDRMTKQLVRVPGFRDGAQAPASFKVAPTASAFEKSPELVAAILAAWAESQADLRAKVYDLLKERGWELLPIEADRTKLPGFLTNWPGKDEDFDVLNAAYAERHPGDPATTDDVSLMVVWLSGRLPFANDDDNDEAAQAEGGEPETDETKE